MTLYRKSQDQGHRERSQFRRSHQGLFPFKVSSLYWLMRPRTNLNTEVNQVNQNVDRQTDGHQSISRNCSAILPTTKSKKTSKLWLWNGTKNINTASQMLLDNCYAFSLLLYSSSLKKKFFEEGVPHWLIMALPWIRPWVDLAQKSIQMCGVISTLSLTSLVNIHQVIL